MLTSSGPANRSSRDAVAAARLDLAAGRLDLAAARAEPYPGLCQRPPVVAPWGV